MINSCDISEYASKNVLPGKVSGSLWEGRRLTLGVCNDQEKKTFSCIEYKKERNIQDLITNAYLYEKMRQGSYVPVQVKDFQKETIKTVYIPSTLASALDIVYFCQFGPVLGDPIKEKEFLDSVANVKRIMDRLKENEFFAVTNSIEEQLIEAIESTDMSEESDSIEPKFSISVKNAIAWKTGNRWKVEPSTSTAEGSFARVFLTENVALRILFDQYPYTETEETSIEEQTLESFSLESDTESRSLSQLYDRKGVVEILNQEGPSVGIQRSKIGLLFKVYDINEKISIDFDVGQIASKRCKGDCRMGGYSFQEVPKMCAQITEGLKTLHNRGIYHLDIKPENILYDGEGIAYLADFDGAIFLSEKMRDVLFTITMMTRKDSFELKYLCNNQDSFNEIEKHNLLSQLDVFALGSTFYQLACIAKNNEAKFPYEIGASFTSSRNYLDTSEIVLSDSLIDEKSEGQEDSRTDKAELGYISSSDTTDFKTSITEDESSCYFSTLYSSDEKTSYSRGDPFAGRLLNAEELKEDMSLVYNEPQIAMILRMLSEDRNERPTAEEIASVFPQTLFEGALVNKQKDYFAGMKKDKIAAPTVVKEIQKVFHRNYPTFITNAKRAKDFLLRV